MSQTENTPPRTRLLGEEEGRESSATIATAGVQRCASGTEEKTEIGTAKATCTTPARVSGTNHGSFRGYVDQSATFDSLPCVRELLEAKVRLLHFALFVILHNFEGIRIFSASVSLGCGSHCFKMWLEIPECDFSLLDHSRTSFPFRHTSTMYLQGFGSSP